MSITVPVRVLPHGEGLPLPDYATADSAGVDLYAAVTHDILLPPLSRELIPTGLQLAIPQGYEAQIRPRSGLALKHGISLVNAPGTIDADYRGEIGVIVINLSQERFVVTRGMRIAQLVLAPVTQLTWEVSDTLPGTSRAGGGFGSTGTH